MTIQRRQATIKEINEYLVYKTRPRFRHFVREIYNPRAEHGVSHRQYSSSKIRMIDGLPHVQHLGDLIEITATHYTLDTGRTFISDLRVKSEYLPGAF